MLTSQDFIFDKKLTEKNSVYIIVQESNGAIKSINSVYKTLPSAQKALDRLKENLMRSNIFIDYKIIERELND